MSNTVDHIAANELALYALNFSGAHYNMVGRTLGKFYKQGTYDHDRASQYVDRYLLVPAAKDYVQCCGSMTDSWCKMFNKATRMEAAEAIARGFVVEFKLDNFF
jgi:hypothetical protein